MSVCARCVVFRVDKKRDKLDRQILDSQERAFWDVHRPAVSSFPVDPVQPGPVGPAVAIMGSITDAGQSSPLIGSSTLHDGSDVSTSATSRICPTAARWRHLFRFARSALN